MSTARLTKEVVNERLLEQGNGIVLVGEYLTNKTKTTFQCKNGHQWDTIPKDVMRGQGCPHCSGNSPLTKELVNERLLEQGKGIVLVGEYVNAKVKTIFSCKYGHQWGSRPSHIINGIGCPHCSGNAPLTKELVNERLLIQGNGITLTGEYVNAQVKTIFSCKYGHQWGSRPHNVMRGQGCPHCSGNAPLTKELVNERLLTQGKGITLIGSYVNTQVKTIFSCKYGHQWSATPGHIINGIGCPHCSGQASLTKEIVNERLIEQGNGITLTGEYVNTSTKTTFKCDEGHQWGSTPNSVMSGTGCPTCATYGFDPTKPSIIYAWEIEHPSIEGSLIKVGITNLTAKKRQQGFNACQSSTFTLLGTIDFAVGADALALENKLKQDYSHLRVDPKVGKQFMDNGYTELYQPEIMEYLQFFLPVNPICNS